MANSVTMLSSSPPSSMILNRSGNSRDLDCEVGRKNSHTPSRMLGGLSSVFLNSTKSAQFAGAYFPDFCDLAVRNSFLDNVSSISGSRDSVGFSVAAVSRSSNPVAHSLNSARQISSLQTSSVPHHVAGSEKCSSLSNRSRFSEVFKPAVRKVGFQVEKSSTQVNAMAVSEPPTSPSGMPWKPSGLLSLASDGDLLSEPKESELIEDIFWKRSLLDDSSSLRSAQQKLNELSELVETVSERRIGSSLFKDFGLEAAEKELLAKAQKLHANFSDPLVKKAFAVAASAHRGQVRKDGKVYLSHCLETAMILSQCGCTGEVVAAGLLHDVLDDTLMEESTLLTLFGQDILSLVQGVSKLSEYSQLFRENGTWTVSSFQVDSLLGMVQAMSDPKVVLIKLADRLHNLRTLEFLPAEKQLRFAEESMRLFAPLANRLGLWAIKAEMEDLCFSFLHPREHKELSEKLTSKRQSEALREAILKLDSQLRAQKVQIVDLSGRPKSLYGVFSKMKKKGYELEDIKDIRGIRLIVEDVESCYRAMSVVNSLWDSEVDHQKDYIKSPKPNGYQSIHLVVNSEPGYPLEVQIRTRAMHLNAEYGVAAHWRYKEESTVLNNDSAESIAMGQTMVAYHRWLLSWHAELADLKVRVSPASPDLRPPCPFPTHHENCPFSHPPHHPLLVAVLQDNQLEVEELSGGKTLGDLLALRKVGRKGVGKGALWQVLVNREVVDHLDLELKMGDRVEIHPVEREEAFPVLLDEEPEFAFLDLGESKRKTNQQKFPSLVTLG